MNKAIRTASFMILAFIASPPAFAANVVESNLTFLLATTGSDAASQMAGLGALVSMGAAVAGGLVGAAVAPGGAQPAVANTEEGVLIQFCENHIIGTGIGKESVKAQNVYSDLIPLHWYQLNKLDNGELELRDVPEDQYESIKATRCYGSFPGRWKKMNPTTDISASWTPTTPPRKRDPSVPRPLTTSGGPKLVALENIEFGWPVTGTVEFPKDADTSGIAIAAPAGTPIKAAADGVVMVVMPKYLVIRHANGVGTLYKTLTNVLVKKGDAVTRGQPIGDLSSSEEQSRLFFDLVVTGSNTKVKPLDYLPAPL